MNNNFLPFSNSFELGKEIKVPFDRDIKESVQRHKIEFFLMNQSIYFEELPNIFQIVNAPSTINNYEIEYNLKNFNCDYGETFGVVVGMTSNNVLKVIGYILKSIEMRNNLFTSFNERLTEKDINFTIPDKERLNKYLEISNTDNFKTGNFVVVYDKQKSRISDYNIINFYLKELSEVRASRYSLYIQSKLSKLIKSEQGDTDAVEIANNIWQGQPFILASDDMDTDSLFQELSSISIETLIGLKNVEHNIRAELNCELGIFSNTIEKEGGINPAETLMSQTTSNLSSNKRFDSRKIAWDGLNKRYNLNITPQINYNSMNRILEINKEVNNGAT